MLLTFSVTNYRSLRDEVELSLLRDQRLMSRAEGRLLKDISPIAAIYGSNASGKSNLLSAIRFMSAAVANSYSKHSASAPIPVTPFLLDEKSQSSPTRFEIQVLIDGVRHQYGFEVTRGQVSEEWLYVYPHGRRQMWFERFGDEASLFRFGKSFSGRNKMISELTRSNALFLSTAIASNHEQLAPLWGWFDSRLIATDAEDSKARLSTTLRELREDDEMVDRLVKLLKFSDLGVCGLEVSQTEYSDEEKERMMDVARALMNVRKDSSTHEVADEEGAWRQAFEDVSLKLSLKHSSSVGNVSLPFNAESLGTRSLVAMGGVVLKVLESGGTLLIDEIDTSLHPRLVREIVQLFQFAKSNPNGAQLIFTSHDTSLLSSVSNEPPALERDQIWFTDKDQEGVTQLYALTDFHPRKMENLERGYLQGRYGAVPVVYPEELLPVLGSEN